MRALREGRDVVVDAPTGAGKTFIYELFQPTLRGQAIFTVPTRALANDKLAEWRARGWNVGLSTGDLAFGLDARVVVATLETQKSKLLRREGPALLVVDEYQMIGDPGRGVTYELAIALAPRGTQLLLLSGSVANPQDVVAWLRRLGRDALLVQHRERPVPLEEIDLQTLPNRAPASVRGWWPRLIANALRADLGPVLMFAPRRKAAEDFATQLAAALPADTPLSLTAAEQQLAGGSLARLLRKRVAYHHSGLSYAQRAGLIEPLAKKGQLRVVVATMGLAAGINFSMRSVVITGTSYKVGGNLERQVRADELLQMFGRAGRRGLDEIGYALVTDNPPRMIDAQPLQLRRAEPLDWPTLLAVMHAAAVRGEDPFGAAVELNRNLYTPRDIALGVEHSRQTGPMPCGLAVDMERARFARRSVTEMLNSRGHWELRGEFPVESALGQALVFDRERWRPALSLARSLEGIGLGNLCKLDRVANGQAPPTDRTPSPRDHEERSTDTREAAATAHLAGSHEQATTHRVDPPAASASAASAAGPIPVETPEINLDRRVHQRTGRYGRELPVGIRRPDGHLALAPWLRAKLAKTRLDRQALQRDVLPQLANWAGGRLIALEARGEQLVARFAFDEHRVAAWVDTHGVALLDPPLRRDLPVPCRGCPELPWCEKVEIVPSPAYIWRRLGLIEADGRPTRRGRLFSFFQHAEGLAVAAAIEDERYPIDELIFDLANLRAGPRFAGDDSPYGGRLGIRCAETYERAEVPGYLTMGVPLEYGACASEALRALLTEGVPRSKLLTESLRAGDLERALIEWRSLLRHITWAPDLDWTRWRALRDAAAVQLENTVSPTILPSPAARS